MKIHLEFPAEWDKVLRQAALDANCKSVREWVRQLIEQSAEVTTVRSKTGVLELPDLGQPWGGSREAQYQDATKSHDATLGHDGTKGQDATSTTIEPPKLPKKKAEPPQTKTPAQLIAERKAEAAKKHPPAPTGGTPKSGTKYTERDD